MSHAKGARPELWFLTPPAPTRWRAFMAYFAERGYRCYTWPMMDGTAASHAPRTHEQPPAAGIVVVAWRRFPTTPLPGPAPKGRALLAPSLAGLPRLWRRAPSTSSWIGLGSRQGLVTRLVARRLRFLPHLTVHTFDGLGADLPFAPGWERVAYALRRWLEVAVEEV